MAVQLWKESLFDFIWLISLQKKSLALFLPQAIDRCLLLID